MLLLNAVRVLITILGLVITEAFRVAYNLEGVTLLGVLGLVMFVCFVMSDFAEDQLIEYFNKEEEA